MSQLKRLRHLEEENRKRSWHDTMPYDLKPAMRLFSRLDTGGDVDVLVNSPRFMGPPGGRSTPPGEASSLRHQCQNRVKVAAGSLETGIAYRA